MENKFKDQRGREWEWFIDEVYFGCTCVRCLSCDNSKNFNSQLSFHFPTNKQALEFVELIKQSL